ncbi:MAG: hypothetical protein JNM89_05605 [Hyphomicrobiaceae bacterium]|nr:hypothetical protein [Hyphomicrobiaceae bacterium]
MADSFVVEWTQTWDSTHGSDAMLAIAAVGSNYYLSGFNFDSGGVFIVSLLQANTGALKDYIKFPALIETIGRNLSAVSADLQTLYIAASDRRGGAGKGCVHAIDLRTLELKWSLPFDAGVTAICSDVPGSLYVGFGETKGVIRLDAGTGAFLGSAPSPDRVYSLATTSNPAALLVGRPSRASALDLGTLATLWDTSLSGECTSTADLFEVNIAGGVTVNQCYAGGNGQVWMLDAANGAVQKTQDLGVGQHPVFFAMDGEFKSIYAGCYANVFSLNALDVAILWRQLLVPEAKITTTGMRLVSSFDDLFVSAVGNIFQLTVAGEILRSTPVTFNVNASPSGALGLAVSSSSGTIVCCDLNQSYGLLRRPVFPRTRAWMTALRRRIGNVPLRNVAMPGTHDSGSYAINAFSPAGLDAPPPLPEIYAALKSLGYVLPQTAIGAVIANWSVAQGWAFGEQLKRGVRYLDLRLQADGGKYNFVHGLVSAPLGDLVAQVADFYARKEYEDEVVILHFNHFYNFSSPSDYEAVAGALQKGLGSLLIPPTVGADVTLNDIWKTSGRVIVIFDAAVGDGYDFIWSSSAISSPWPNTTSVDMLKGILYTNLVTHRGASNFLVLQGVLTPDGGMIAKGFIPFSSNPGSLWDLGVMVNPQLMKWIVEWSHLSPINIVICDWMNDFAIENIVGLNSAAASPHMMLSEIHSSAVERHVMAAYAKVVGGSGG